MNPVSTMMIMAMRTLSEFPLTLLPPGASLVIYDVCDALKKTQNKRKLSKTGFSVDNPYNTIRLFAVSEYLKLLLEGNLKVNLLLGQMNIISGLSRIGALDGFLGRLESGEITIFRIRNLLSACRESIENSTRFLTIQIL